jgi:hypothetical protein
MRCILPIVALCLAAPLSAGAGNFPRQPGAKAPAVLPETAQGRAGAAFLAMLNDASPEAVSAFESAHRAASVRRAVSLEERTKQVAELKRQHGGLRLTEVIDSGPRMLTLLAKDGSGRSVLLDFEFDVEDPAKIRGVLMDVGDNSVRPQMLTPPQIEEAVEAACRALEAEYVFPEVAAKMAKSVRDQLAAGAYDDARVDRTLARRLTQDFRAVSNDLHLRVNAAPERPGSGGGRNPDAGDMARGNYAFRKVEVLPGNIGYIRFDAFIESEEAKRTAAAALGFVANCDAVVFDLRSNGGGSPEMIQFITSYIFGERTHLNDMVDRNGSVVEEYWTLEEVPGKRLKKDVSIYVLTSGRTFSGAEEFSYNLRNLKRATIVGETTGGGAHPVKGVRINDRFMVGVPYMRAQNPISKTNWEGKGVAPDVEVPADQALDVAIDHARAAMAARGVEAR